MARTTTGMRARASPGPALQNEACNKFALTQGPERLALSVHPSCPDLLRGLAVGRRRRHGQGAAGPSGRAGPRARVAGVPRGPGRPHRAPPGAARPGPPRYANLGLPWGAAGAMDAPLSSAWPRPLSTQLALVRGTAAVPCRECSWPKSGRSCRRRTWVRRSRRARPN